jgi:hypothetical protein
MVTARKSLSDAVNSWLTPLRAIPFRVSSLRRAECKRCVRVEAKASTGVVAIFFFQHSDGAWHVFPPAPHRVTMRVA